MAEAAEAFLSKLDGFPDALKDELKKIKGILPEAMTPEQKEVLELIKQDPDMELPLYLSYYFHQIEGAWKSTMDTDFWENSETKSVMDDEKMKREKEVYFKMHFLSYIGDEGDAGERDISRKNLENSKLHNPRHASPVARINMPYLDLCGHALS